MHSPTLEGHCFLKKFKNTYLIKMNFFRSYLPNRSSNFGTKALFVKFYLFYCVGAKTKTKFIFYFLSNWKALSENELIYSTFSLNHLLSTLLKLEISTLYDSLFTFFRRVEISSFRRVENVEIKKQTNAKQMIQTKI